MLVNSKLSQIMGILGQIPKILNKPLTPYLIGMKKSFSKALLLLILLALLLRFPWLYTTMEKDEGTFGYTAWRWASGDGLYVDLLDNKPPLLYLIYYAMIQLGGNSVIPVRIFNNLLFVASIIFFFKFTEHVFSKKNALFSTLFYIVFMNVPVFEGYLAMSEPLLIPFFIMSVYFFERYISTRKICFIFLSSIFALISLMIKQQAAFIFLILISGLFVCKEKDKLRKISFIILIPFATMLAIFLLDKPLFLNLLQRTWKQLAESPLGFSYGYEPFNYNFLIFLEGSVLFLFSVIGLIKVLKSEKERKDYFLLSWLFFALFSTLIPPAYGHYYVFSIPPLAVFAGTGLVYVIDSRQDKKLFFLIVAILLLITSRLVIGHFPDSKLNTGYLWWGWSSLESYDQQVRVAEFIRNTTSEDDRIFMSDWEPSLFWYSNRKPIYPANLTIAGCRAGDPNKNQDFVYGLHPALRADKLILLGSAEKCYPFNPFLLVEPKKVYKMDNVEVWSDLTCKDFDKTEIDIDNYHLCKALVENEFSSCSNISNVSIQFKCYYFLALKNNNFSIFLDYEKRYTYKDSCYLRLSRKLGDVSLCENVSNPLRDYCRGMVLGNASYCDKLQLELFADREICHQFVNWGKNKIFNLDSCISIMRLKYSNTFLQNFYCRLFQKELTGDVKACNYIYGGEFAIFCMAFATDEEKLCYALEKDSMFNSCMAETTSNPNYCEKYSEV